MVGLHMALLLSCGRIVKINLRRRQRGLLACVEEEFMRATKLLQVSFDLVVVVCPNSSFILASEMTFVPVLRIFLLHFLVVVY